ncbi:hypothetical protein Btru_034659, partial [Bulinus truncatus]
VFQESQYNLLHAVSLLLAMSSSVANPVMYGWFNTNFRKAFCELLGFQEVVSGNLKFSSNDRHHKKYSSLRNHQEYNQLSRSPVNFDTQILRFNSSPVLRMRIGRHSLNDLSMTDRKQFSLDKCMKCSHSLQDLKHYRYKEETSLLEYQQNALAKEIRLKMTERNPLVVHGHDGVSIGHPYGVESLHRRDCYMAHHESSLAICSPDDKTVSLHLLNVVVEVSPETRSTHRAHSSSDLDADLK